MSLDIKKDVLYKAYRGPCQTEELIYKNVLH